ncbi:hypothetical protein J1N35_044304, partial [Gossypium stocksii]
PSNRCLFNRIPYYGFIPFRALAEIFVDFYPLPSSPFTHSLLEEPYLNLTKFSYQKHSKGSHFLFPSTLALFSFIQRQAVDRATRKDAQIVTDIIEKINVEDVATTNTHEERNDFHGCKAFVSLDDMDLSTTQPQPPRNQGDSKFSKKKKFFDASDHISSTSFTDAATLLAENTRTFALKSVGVLPPKC